MITEENEQQKSFEFVYKTATMMYTHTHTHCFIQEINFFRDNKIECSFKVNFVDEHAQN